MGCFSFRSSKTPSSSAMKGARTDQNGYYNNPEIPKNIRHEVLLQIPVCRVHLVEAGEALELANGDFKLTRISDQDLCLAIIVSVGNNLTWPLTKDEPVLKLDSLNYLFSLPMTEDEPPLSYGVSFCEHHRGYLATLDSLLKNNSCFSDSTTAQSKGEVDWKEFAPRVENYNNFLAKAIAGGTGHIVKGIFMLTDAYANQILMEYLTYKYRVSVPELLTHSVHNSKFHLKRVERARKPDYPHRSVFFADQSLCGIEAQNQWLEVLKGGEMIQANNNNNNYNGVEVKSGVRKKESENINKGGALKRVKKMSKMTEALSKTMLDGVGIATGSVMAPMFKSKAGEKFIATAPGQVLLASLDAVNKVLDAVEVAEKQALLATSTAASREVKKRYGDEAGENTADALATVGHLGNTAWNIIKIRKALNPASSVSTGVLKNAAKK